MIMAKANTKVVTAKPKRTDYELPALLSFRRSFEMTDGLFSAERTINNKVETENIEVFDHGQRTTKSHDTSKKSGDTQRSGDDSGNLVNGQQAKLPNGFDTLVVSMHMRVLEIRAEPDSCSSDTWHNAIKTSIEATFDTGILETMSRYYAYNIANASWIWRNRDVADQIEVTISYGDEVIVIQDALDLSARPVLPANSDDVDPHEECREIDGLAKAIEFALSGRTKSLKLSIVAKAKMMPGQSVWPSQRYMPTKRVVGKQDNGKDIVSGRDFYMSGGFAAIRAEKMGSRLRTFDRDHGHSIFPHAIIPVEPNGGSLEYGINLRRNGNDLRSLLPVFIGIKKEDGGAEFLTLSNKDAQYVIGCIIRGGVFGGSKEDASPVPVSTPVAVITEVI
jgi:CRISPR-associated protein Csy3